MQSDDTPARPPLTGIRVLELGGIGPAPFAGMLLADLGADVVRVDRPREVNRAGETGTDVLHRGKRSVAVDLKQPAGVAVIRQLAGTADVLIESFRPGVAERLGVGPDDALRWNQRLVYGRMTGWGQAGPRANMAGHDIGYLARTGLLHAIGDGRGPQVPLALVGDFGGGALYLVIGVLAALREAAASGQGQVIDAAVVDGAAHMGTLVYGMLHSGQWQDRRQANLFDGGTPWYGVYETADGKHVAIGPVESRFYVEFVRRLGLEDEVLRRSDRQRWPQLKARLAEVFRTRTRDEWAAVFADGDACVEPVLSLREALHDEHLAARGTFIDLDGVRQPAPAPRLSRTPGRVTGPPCRPGQNTAEVLADWGVPDPGQLISTGAVVDEGWNRGPVDPLPAALTPNNLGSDANDSNSDSTPLMDLSRSAPLQNRYTRMIGITHPVVQEGMGPFNTARLAAAVSNAGGLGTVSVPGTDGDLRAAGRLLRAYVDQCAQLTDGPFAVNIPVGHRKDGRIATFSRVYLDEVLAARRADVQLAHQLRVVTTSAGFPHGLTDELHDEGIIHQHKVGSTRHAVKAAEAGVDVVIAAGFEMGGHAPASGMNSLVLLPNITERIDTPVLLSGGVRNGRGLAAALCLGADGVALGSRFAASTENADWHPAYAQALLDAGEGSDMVIDGVFGPCRVLRNEASEDFAAAAAAGKSPTPAEKIESMRRAQIDGDVHHGLVLMGQVASGIENLIMVSDFVPRMAAEARQILAATVAGQWGDREVG
jgi:alpha-methylacyl-CoA racemase